MSLKATQGGDGAAFPIGSQRKSPPPLPSQRALDARAPLFQDKEQAVGEVALD